MKVTEEIRDIFLTALAHEDCRDSCVARIFSTKAAVRHAKSARELRIKGWKMIYDLYPETKEGNWTLSLDDGELRKKST